MQRQKSRKLSAVAHLLVLFAIVLGAVKAAAADNCVADAKNDHRYTVFFQKDSSDGLWDGAFMGHNEAVLKRIIHLRQLWPDPDRVRFLFISHRSPSCRRAADCNPHRLLFERFRAISRKMAEVTERLNITAPELAIDIAFRDELGRRFSLPSSPTDADGVTLGIKLERIADAKGTCSGGVRVWDPLLPQIVGAVPGRPVLPLPSKNPVQLSACAKLRSAPHLQNSVIAFWGDGAGAYRRASPRLLAGRVVPAPRQRQTLYLTSRSRLARPAWRRFYAQLTPSFRRPTRLPTSLRSDKQRPGRDKGIGDHGEWYPNDGSLRPERRSDDDMGLCRFTFVPRHAR